MMERVLIVSSNPKAMQVFSELVVSCISAELFCAESCGEARRFLAAQDFALVVILTPLPEEFGYDLARACLQSTAGVILVVRDELERGASYKLCEEGIFVFCLSMGKRMFAYASFLMLSLHRRLAGGTPKEARLQQKMNEIRLVDRAKCLLIQYDRLTEEEAHRYIEKSAMDRRCSKREIAEEILRRYQL